VSADDTFRLRLRRTTVDGVEATVAALPRGRIPGRPHHRVAMDDERLVLRYRGRGRFDAPWTLVARLSQSGDDVVVTGGFSRTTERLIYGIFGVAGAGLVGLAVAIAVAESPASPEFFLCLLGGVLLLLVAALRVVIAPRVRATEASDASHLLRALLEPADPPRRRRGFWRWLTDGPRSDQHHTGRPSRASARTRSSVARPRRAISGEVSS
jgi:hypothetical protein